MTLRVVALHRYPVKSLGGQALSQTLIAPRGLAGDRCWMVVTPDGRFLTRRELPAMARVAVDWTAQAIVLSQAGHADLIVPVPVDAPPVPVRVWGDSVTAHDAGDAAADWLSARLGQAVRLVHLPDGVVRPVNAAYGRAGDQVGFADAFPLLITVVESLDAVNRQLARPISMARFRPNLVLAGAAAFAEDGWQALLIGAVRLRVVKPCTRCVITTQDPDSGAVDDPGEPLRTLRAMGRVMPGDARREPVFGQNAIADGTGTIALGDRVEVSD